MAQVQEKEVPGMVEKCRNYLKRAPNMRVTRRHIMVICIATFLVLSFTAWYSPETYSSFARSSSSSSSSKGDDSLASLVVPEHKYAYAAFLAEPEQPSDNDEDDRYFVATRILAYSLLYDPDTRTNTSIPFIVLVTQDVKQSKRDRLAADGAIVIPIQKIRVDWVKAGRERWRDVLSKLYLFTLTQYERILFIDSDMLILKQFDAIFHDPASTPAVNRQLSAVEAAPVDEGRQPMSYVFASVSGQGGFNHPWPPRVGNYANAGFVLLQPSQLLFDHYMAVVSKIGSFDPAYPEQNLWNYVHRRKGNMPWQQLDPSWSVNWPTVRDWKLGAGSLHAKWWSSGPEEGMRELALSLKWKMEGYMQGRDLLISQGII